jgi:phage shock protein E
MPRSGRSRLLRSVALAAAVALLLGCHPASPTSATISGNALADEIRNGTAPLILDVRSEEEYKAGHIPGSVNIPHDQLATRLSELQVPKSAEVVVHCEGGGRAAKAEAVLAASGYTKVVDLEGHMKGWRESGLPVE